MPRTKTETYTQPNRKYREREVRRRIWSSIQSGNGRVADIRSGLKGPGPFASFYAFETFLNRLCEEGWIERGRHRGSTTGPLEDFVFFAREKPAGICFVCGCSDDDCSRCVERDPDGEPCHWVSLNLCSACSALTLPDVP